MTASREDDEIEARIEQGLEGLDHDQKKALTYALCKKREFGSANGPPEDDFERWTRR